MFIWTEYPKWHGPFIVKQENSTLAIIEFQHYLSQHPSYGGICDYTLHICGRVDINIFTAPPIIK